MSETTHRCSKRVYDARSLRGHQCTIAAKVERDGKWYCKRHDPEATAKRRQEQEKKWREKWDREAEKSKRERDAAAEQKRRAEAYTDLLEALEAVMNSWRVICSGQGWDPLDLQEHRAAVAVIAKARGEA